MPPLVSVPTVAASPPSSATAAPTRSFSIRATLGKAVGSRAFVHWNAAWAAAEMSSISARPES